MSKKTIEIDGKKYVIDDKNLEAVDKEKEVKKEENKGKEYNKEEMDKATDKVMSKLGLDKIKADIDGIKKIVEKKTDKKVSGLIDLENLMKKSVEEMTSREKIIGFFSALIMDDTPVLKALSEGVAPDGGYLFPDEFRYEIIRDIEEKPHMRKTLRLSNLLSLNWVNSGKVLFNRIIPSQAFA